MKILGIETSCDETAAAVIENGTEILSNVVVSQIDIHKAYGGVVPEIAARSHIEAIQPVIKKALAEANLKIDQIDAIAVTHTPGLLGSLLIGTLTARTLSIIHKIPLYPTHHLKSHIYANWLTNNVSENSGNDFKDNRDPAKHIGRLFPAGTSLALKSFPEFPLIALVVSGGHTQIIFMENHNTFEIIGTTRDDAIGEVFDKIAKILGLPYPGGPSIGKAALNGDPKKYKLPHPKVPDYDFSFSGLKTAVLRAIQKELSLPISTPSHELSQKLTQTQINDFAASFQDTATDILVEKLSQAVQNYQPASVCLAGGVAANSILREKITQKWAKPDQNPQIFFPKMEFSTDNAAMVASAAYFSIKQGQKPINPYELDISPRSKIS